MYWVRSLPFSLFMYWKEKQYKIAMILLCPVQGPWASSWICMWVYGLLSQDPVRSLPFSLNIWTLVSPKLGQDQVSWGVSVLCWHAAPIANILWNLSQLGKNSVIRSRSVIGSQIWCSARSMENDIDNIDYKIYCFCFFKKVTKYFRPFN